MSPLTLLPESWKDRLRRRAGVVTFRSRMENLRAAGFAPRRIIDAGACRGDWARLAHELFPAAALLLIEPQAQLAPVLATLCAGIPGARFRAALLGSAPGRAKFALDGTNSRIVPDAYVPRPHERLTELDLETLAAVAAAEGFPACDFLKLDLQGQELAALEGAGALFGQTEVILTEASVLPIGTVPLIREVIEKFHHQGYRLYDIFGSNYRPLDRALWQTDLIFVRKNSPLLAAAGRWI